MNFADSMKTRKNLNPDKSKREQVELAAENWKKEFSLNDISNAIREAACSLSEEIGDPSFMLFGMLITLDIAHKLFPKEELDKYMASQEEKGDE